MRCVCIFVWYVDMCVCIYVHEYTYVCISIATHNVCNYITETDVYLGISRGALVKHLP